MPGALKEDKYSRTMPTKTILSTGYLNDEYTEFIQYAVAELCRKRPSPLLKGKLNIWACAITHAIGVINFLDDSSQTPHVKVSKLYKAFGVKAVIYDGYLTVYSMLAL